MCWPLTGFFSPRKQRSQWEGGATGVHESSGVGWWELHGQWPHLFTGLLLLHTAVSHAHSVFSVLRITSVTLTSVLYPLGEHNYCPILTLLCSLTLQLLLKRLQINNTKLWTCTKYSLTIILCFQERKTGSRSICCNRQQEAAACSSSVVISVWIPGEPGVENM